LAKAPCKAQAEAAALSELMNFDYMPQTGQTGAGNAVLHELCSHA
jgi:hypothetical protein